jgi:haloalkane dehalogenase
MRNILKSVLIALSFIFLTTTISQADSGKVTATDKFARHDFPYRSNYVEVFGSNMHFVDTGGDGSTIVMIHGQPTWSYLWRNVIPHLENNHRVIALDLIGFGKFDRPDIQYLATDHAKYLQGFMDALELEEITLVIHDWSSILGFNFAAKNAERVKAIAFLEALVRTGPVEAPYGPVKIKLSGAQEFSFAQFAKILAQIKTPGVGEKMTLEDNFFIEQLVMPSFADLLTEDEKNAYREPFSEGKNRLPMLQFPRDVPVDGKTPAYTVEMVDNYSQYLFDVSAYGTN